MVLHAKLENMRTLPFWFLVSGLGEFVQESTRYVVCLLASCSKTLEVPSCKQRRIKPALIFQGDVVR